MRLTRLLHANAERDLETVFATLLQLRAGALVITSAPICDKLTSLIEKTIGHGTTPWAAARVSEPIPKDEKVLGFNSQSDQYGGSISYPLIADCQDETLRRELLEHGLESNDAEHLTQAVCNDCGVFLTRDEATIINPHRQWLEQRFPNLKIRLPSELLNELASAPLSGR